MDDKSDGMLYLVDSGAQISILPRAVYDQYYDRTTTPLSESDMTIKAGNDTRVECHGIAHCLIKLGGVFIRHPFYICEDATVPILGIKFQEVHDLHLWPAEKAMFLKGKQITSYDNKGVRKRSKILMLQTYTIDPKSEVIVQGKLSGGDVIQDDKPCVVDRSATCYERTGALVCRIVATPRQNVVPVRMINVHDTPLRVYKGTVLGTLQPCVQMQAMQEIATVDACSCDCSCLATDGGKDVVRVCCHTLERCGTEQEKYESLLAGTEDEDFGFYHKFELDGTVPSHVRDLYRQSLPTLRTVKQRDRLARILTDYSDVFARNPDDIGRTDWVTHVVDTGDAKPVHQRCRRFCRAHIDIIRSTIAKLSEGGIIRPSNSNWAANPVVVKKKSGEDRVCIDYRGLNAVTINPDSYMLPRIDDTLDALAGSRYFCTLDMIQGYHQVVMDEESKHKTAFHAPFCNPTQWEYNYMPFGLVKAPRTFQRLMDKVIQGLEYETALCYIDDIIVFGRSIEETMDRLMIVFGRLRSANLKLKAKKCLLFSMKVKFLGHVISEQGVSTDPDKVKDVVGWHTPRTVKQIRSFLGMVNYYGRFIKDLQGIAAPLHDVTKKNAKFLWGLPQQIAFDALKESLTSAPVLSYPMKEGMFILDTDASNTSMGGVLSQMQKDGSGQWVEKPIAYASRKFDERERKYCARRRELLAIIRMVKHFDVYLRGPTFLIRTDHASLRYIRTVQSLPAQFFRWIMMLEEYSYKIEVRKGVDHANADGMSRGCHGKGCICDELVRYEKKYDIHAGQTLSEEESQVCVFECNPYVSRSMGAYCDNGSCVVQAFKLNPIHSMKEIAERQRMCPDVGPIYEAFQKDPLNAPTWDSFSGNSTASKYYLSDWNRLVLYDNVLYRIWESVDGLHTAKQIILPRCMISEMCAAVHDGKVTAHMGRRRTIHALQHFCYWFKMYRDVAFWVQSCDKCQRRKHAQPSPRAPMKIYVSGVPNERIAMDVCGPLVVSKKGNVYVLVITDCFSKYTEAYAMPNQQAATIAEILVKRWIHTYGEPSQVHSDQGSNFMSELVTQVCEIYDIEKTRTTPYHPQGDGQVERYNKTMMNIVYSMVEKNDEWDEVLPFAQSAYNGTVHEVTSFTPNFLWFSRELRSTVGRIVPDPELDKQTTYVEYVRKMRDRMTQAYDITRAALKRAALVTKKYYDRKMRLIKYVPGDQVLIKDHSLRPDKGQAKLMPKYAGPYWILDKLGDVNFRIQEREDGPMKVVHHNRMKPYMSRQPVVIPQWVRRRSKVLRVADSLPVEGGEVPVLPCRTVAPHARPVKERANRVRRATRKALGFKRIPVRRGRPIKRPKPTPIVEESINEGQKVVLQEPSRTRSGRIVRPPDRY